MFTSSETKQITAALEVYDDCPRGDVIPEVQHKVCASALRKFRRTNIKPEFTKQEYTMMLAAVLYVIRALHHTYQPVPLSLEKLSEKLASLAE